MTTSTTLTFQLYTGREAFPVEGATVTVTDPATGNAVRQTTDGSGRTPPRRRAAAARQRQTLAF